MACAFQARHRPQSHNRRSSRSIEPRSTSLWVFSPRTGSMRVSSTPAPSQSTLPLRKRSSTKPRAVDSEADGSIDPKAFAAALAGKCRGWEGVSTTSGRSPKP